MADADCHSQENVFLAIIVTDCSSLPQAEGLPGTKPGKSWGARVAGPPMPEVERVWRGGRDLGVQGRWPGQIQYLRLEPQTRAEGQRGWGWGWGWGPMKGLQIWD